MKRRNIEQACKKKNQTAQCYHTMLSVPVKGTVVRGTNTFPVSFENLSIAMLPFSHTAILGIHFYPQECTKKKKKKRSNRLTPENKAVPSCILFNDKKRHFPSIALEFKEESSTFKDGPDVQNCTFCRESCTNDYDVTRTIISV